MRGTADGGRRRTAVGGHALTPAEGNSPFSCVRAGKSVLGFVRRKAGRGLGHGLGKTIGVARKQAVSQLPEPESESAPERNSNRGHEPAILALTLRPSFILITLTLVLSGTSLFAQTAAEQAAPMVIPPPDPGVAGTPPIDPGVVAVPPVPPAAVTTDTTFGDIVIRAEQTGGGSVSHGYAEFRFQITNNGSQQHTVEVAAPAIRFGFSPGSLSRIARSVVLAPGTTATLSLYQPSLVVSGHGAAVHIDGVKQDGEVVFAPVYASGPLLRVLGSRAVSDAELRTALGTHLRADEFEIQTAATETREWSRNWLALTPFDAIVVTARELGAAEADVRQTIDRFTRTGGVVVVLDSLPEATCAGRMSSPENLSFCPRGFGLRVSTVAPMPNWTPDDVKTLVDEIRATQEPLKAWGGSYHPTSGPDFAIVENLSVPLRGLFIGMILFAITAGPLNIMVLSKMNRRIWIIWTLPALAIVTSALVIFIAMFSEGWVRATRTDAITWIDPDTREATTIGWTGFYATVAPGDGLRFDPQTELQAFGGSRNNVLEIDWTSGQHLETGWISSRVASTFRVRKSEPRRERLSFRRTPDGISVSNGLGTPLDEIWVADENGTMWTAKEIEAGGSKDLARSPAGVVGRNGPRELYKQDWLKSIETAQRSPGAFLEPGSWMAIADGGPFIEDAMRGIRTRNGKTLVMSELRFGDTE